MPTSHYETINAVMNLIAQMSPASVLDVGIGFGKMGLLCREYLDIWFGRYSPDKWATRIDGIEIFPEYKNPIYEYCYDNVLFGNIMDHLDTLSDYDLVLLIDVLEHLSEEDGYRLLGTITNNYIVVTPKAFSQNNIEVWGNEHERHISLWGASEFPQSLILDRKIVGWKSVKKKEIDMAVDIHYRPLFQYLSEHECSNILEVGTHCGENAVRMIRASKAPEEEITYFGFDMFEPLSPEQEAKEFSGCYSNPPSLDEVKAKIEGETTAKVLLFKGDSKETIPQHLESLPLMDIIYIDGGHSIPTVTSDWDNLKQLMGEETVTFFDDYFMDFSIMGCKFLRDPIIGQGYQVTVHDEMDSYKNSGGSLRDQLMSVRRANPPVVVRDIAEGGKAHAKLLHFALTSDELIYPYYLSISSALKTQKVDEVMLWCFKQPTGRYYPLLADRITLKIIERPDYPALRNKDLRFQNANLKDWILWQALYEYGGMFFDLDTFSLKNASDLLDGTREMVVELEVDNIEDHNCGVNVAILMAEKGSPLIKSIMDSVMEVVMQDDMIWGGCWGNFNNTVKSNRDKIKLVDSGVLGGYDSKEAGLYSEDGHILDRARVLHLYAYGDPTPFSQIDEDWIATSNTTFSKLVKRILTREEWGPFMEEAKKLAIPEDERNVHFCSTGPEFPYMYYISVMTALKAYGRDKVILWIVQEPKSEYYELLKDRLTIKKVATDNVPDFPALRDKDDHFKYTNIFNYLIWNICYKFGGVLMGLDTITLKPYWDLLEDGKEIFAPVDEKEVLHFAMEGAIIRKGSSIIKEVIKDATSILNGVTMKWGDAGIVPYICHTKLNIEKATLGEYGQVGRCPDGILLDDGELIHPDTRCFSLYERTTKISAKLSEQYVVNSNSLYARLVKEILPPEEFAPGTRKLPKPAQRESLEKLKEHKRFHLLGLPHIPTNKVDGLACAYSQKVIKMAKMLKSMGHTVFFYGVEDSDVECDEFIQVSTRDILRKTYGDYDWKAVTFKHSYGDLAYNTFNSNAIKEINKRKAETDFLLTAWPGNKPAHDAIATNDRRDHDKLFLSVESGIGYAATFTDFRVFESYAWMHHVYGIEIGKKGQSDTNGRNYDVVIPNYFEPEDFEFREDKEDYFLYLGRIIIRKGTIQAGEICEAIGAKLLMAGQDGGEMYRKDGPPLLERLVQSPNVEYVGFADLEKRRQLLAKAKALLIPTLYIGPFEGVSIEAALSGTPVITTDFGAFPENVLHGTTGYRCRTKDQFVWAARNIDNIKPADCYRWAMDNFTIDRVRYQYEEYWDMLLNIKCADGWSTMNPKRTELNWLNRVYPQRP